MLGVAFATALPSALFVATLAAQTAQPDPPRVDPAEAIKQLVKRVEPEIPESAMSARVFGTVVAEIIVDVKGRVESVKVIKPVPLLSGPAAEAIWQWEFKPFLIGGRAARVRTEVSIDFPKPAAATGRNLEKEYYDAAVSCRTLVESKSPQARAACQDAISLADALPAEHWDRRSEARFFAAQHAMNTAQYSAAVALFDESLALWLKNRPADMRVPQHLLLIALAHQSNRDLPKADAAFARAVAAYDERIAATRAMDDVVRQELETLYANYAALRRALKDEVGARAIEARSARISGARPMPAEPAPLARRTIAGTLCLDAGCENLDEADVADALKRVPPKKRVWFIDAGSDTAANPNITIYLQSDREIVGLRRGRTVFLTKKVSAQGRWEKPAGADPEWAQLMAFDRTPDNVTQRDEFWPFLIRSAGAARTISDDDLIAVSMAIRTAAAATKARGVSEPRLATDVQPWPIGGIELPSSANQVNVYLRSPSRGEVPQIVTLTRENKIWRVTAIGNPAK